MIENLGVPKAFRVGTRLSFVSSIRPRTASISLLDSKCQRVWLGDIICKLSVLLFHVKVSIKPDLGSPHHDPIKGHAPTSTEEENTHVETKLP